MKTKFSDGTNGQVTIEYDDALTGDRVSRTFFERGSYVYEETARGDRQVCDRLQTRGSTLMHHNRLLIDIIRSEYRSMRAQERKEAVKYGFA